MINKKYSSWRNVLAGLLAFVFLFAGSALAAPEPAPGIVPGPEIPAVSGYQSGRLNGRIFYTKTSNASMLFYQKRSSGSLGRVSVPYVTASRGTRYYPINWGGTVLYPCLENGTLSAYCLYANKLEIPVLKANAAVFSDSDVLQQFTLNGRQYYARTSGASMLFYQKKASGVLGRVSAPYVTDKTGTRYYPVNCGGIVLYPVKADGEISSYAFMTDGFETAVLRTAGDHVSVADNTTILPSGVIGDLGGGEIIVPAASVPAGLKPGDILTDGYDAAYRVTDISRLGSSYVLTTTQPALADFVESVSEEGTGYVDMNLFVPAEGVAVEQGPGRSLFSKTFSLEKDLGDGVKLTGYLAETIEEVRYNLDFRLVPWPMIKDAYVILEQNAAAEVKIEGAADGSFGERSQEFLLGSVPVLGTNTIGITIDLKITYDISGEARLTAEISGPVGLRVQNNVISNATSLEARAEAVAEATVKVGPRISFAAKMFGQDVLNASASFGVKLAGSTSVHPEVPLVCMDGRATVYGTLSALDGCLIGDVLNTRPSYTIWNDTTSPVQLHLHCENLVVVPECTYGSEPVDPADPDVRYGTLSGRVASAEDRTQYIAGAEIAVAAGSGSDPLEIISADEAGQYSERLEAGQYYMKVSAPGYIPFDTIQSVEPDQETFVETFLMVAGEEGTDEEGMIGGKIIDAVTGSDIEGVRIEIRRGWNMTEGPELTSASTDGTGAYEVQLPLGNYTLLMIRDGYVPSHINAAVTMTPNYQVNAALSPMDSTEVPAGELRAILTWGEYPYDLDSHLTGPTADGGVLHTYYSSKNHWEDGMLVADLDLDDTTSYGPETTTIHQMQPSGIYSFYVHDYTNRSRTETTEMANSGAQVAVVAGDQVIAVFHIPTTSEGTVWHVFDYDAQTRQLIPVNRFWYCESSYDVGMREMTPFAGQPAAHITETEPAVNGADAGSMDERKEYELQPAA